MKKRIIAFVVSIMFLVSLGGCRQSEQVSYNISKEADNFNVIRRISVINMRTDKPIFELIAPFSISNNSSNEIEVVCQTGPNEYKKHLIYLNAWTMYVIEDISGSDVSPYHYEINFLPEMLLPVTITNSY